MPDKSVIQVTENQCATAKNIAVTVNQNYQQFTLPEKMNEAELAHYNAGVATGWDMAISFILNHGNCQFERDHNA